MPDRYAAFISYASRYADWVTALRQYFEQELRAAKCQPQKIFHDQVDIGAGRAFINRLQEGLDHAARLIFIATPEAVASDWVMKELYAFIDQESSQATIARASC